jgi:hypothetical protein
MATVDGQSLFIWRQNTIGPDKMMPIRFVYMHKRMRTEVDDLVTAFIGGSPNEDLATLPLKPCKLRLRMIFSRQLRN